MAWGNIPSRLSSTKRWGPKLPTRYTGTPAQRAKAEAFIAQREANKKKSAKKKKTLARKKRGR